MSFPAALSHPSRRSIIAAGLACAAGAGPARAAERTKIRDLWAAGGSFSAEASRLAGKSIEMRGYMAPPLKPEALFFVLTRIPMAVCPFCDTEAAWPDDLVVVETRRALIPSAFNDLITVTGVLELGAKTDSATGFVSRVRLVDAVFARA